MGISQITGSATWKCEILGHPAHHPPTEVLSPGYADTWVRRIILLGSHLREAEITCTLSCGQIQPVEEHKEWKHSQRRTMQAHGDHLVFSHNAAEQAAGLWGWRKGKKNITWSVLLLLDIAREKAVPFSIYEGITNIFLAENCSRHNTPGENNSNHPFSKMTDKTTVHWVVMQVGWDRMGRGEKNSCSLTRCLM